MVAVGWTVSASAAGKSNLSREKAAKKSCATGNVKEGIDILADLLVETNIPTYIYNQGRCYQQNRRCDEAVDRFREYLRKAVDISQRERDDVEKQILDCGGAPQVTTPPPPAPEPTPPPSPPAVVESPSPEIAATVLPPSKAESTAGRPLRIAGIAVASVGVASLVTGVFMARKTQDLAQQMRDDLANNRYDRDTASRRSTYETVGWVCYGVGAAAVATGATLYFLGWRAARAEANLTFLPTVDSRSAGLTLHGAF
jgi:hypothetical protein